MSLAVPGSRSPMQVQDLAARQILIELRSSLAVLAGIGGTNDQSQALTIRRAIELGLLATQQGKVYCPLQPKTTGGTSTTAIGGSSGAISGAIRVAVDITSALATGASYEVGETLPINTRVTRAWLEVFDAIVGDGGETLGLGIAVDDVAGILAPAAIAGAPWSAPGLAECIQTGTAATFSEMTTVAGRRLQLEVAGGTQLTDGTFCVVLEYVRVA